MGIMKKSLSLYDRDTEGVLIPQKVKVEVSAVDLAQYPEYKDMEIMIIPLTRGALKKMFGLDGKASDTKPDTDRDEDAEIIVEYCKNPTYTREELIYARPVAVRSIVRTIFSESGVKFDDKAGTKSIEKDDDFGKNSDGLDEKKKKVV